MKRILVSGLINIETTARIEAFPLPYFPVAYPFFGVRSTVSGVGYNVAKALRALGDEPLLLSLIGKDMAGREVWDALEGDGLSRDFVLDLLGETPQSVILYEPSGRRQIHVDLKDIQETPFPFGVFDRLLSECDALALCNINFSRPFLKAARAAGKLVATDVHALSSLDDAYNRDFLEAADLVFLSDESLPCSPEEFAREVVRRFSPRVLVIGRGARGVFLSVPDHGFSGNFPAVRTRPVVNTIGAGDALFTAFLHEYVKNQDPFAAIRKAIVFASYKVGVAGAAEGYLSEAELEELVSSNPPALM